MFLSSIDDPSLHRPAHWRLMAGLGCAVVALACCVVLVLYLRASYVVATYTSDRLAPLIKKHDPLLERALESALSGSDKTMRIRAAWALGQTGNPAHVRALTVALSDASTMMQDAAQAALVTMGPAAVPELVKQIGRPEVPIDCARVSEVLAASRSAASVASLTGYLRTGRTTARMRAARCLGRLGDTAAVSLLATALATDSTEVRRAAAEALGQLRAAGSIDALVAALRSPDAELRAQAACALGRIGDARACAPLCVALTDREQDVSCKSAASLGQLRWSSAVVDTSPMRSHDSLSAGGSTAAWRALSAEVSERGRGWKTCRADIESSMAVIGPHCIDEVVAVARFADPDLQRIAVGVLGRSGDVRAAGALRDAARHGPYAVRKRAIAALGDMGSEATTSLLALLSDTSADIRRDAVKALAATGDAHAVKPLVALVRRRDALDHPNDVAAVALWQSAAGAVARMGVRECAPIFRQIAATQKRGAIQCTAVEALGVLHDTAAADLLIRLATQPDSALQGPIRDVFSWDVRAPALRALVLMGDRRIGERLAPLLTSENREVRRAASEARSALGGL